MNGQIDVTSFDKEWQKLMERLHFTNRKWKRERNLRTWLRCWKTDFFLWFAFGFSSSSNLVESCWKRIHRLIGWWRSTGSKCNHSEWTLDITEIFTQFIDWSYANQNTFFLLLLQSIRSKNHSKAFEKSNFTDKHVRCSHTIKSIIFKNEFIEVCKYNIFMEKENDNRNR